MRKIFLRLYSLLSWIVLSSLLLGVALFFLLETPAPILELIREPLEKSGIHYGKIKGGLLRGFRVYDVNYQGQLKAKELALSVDLKQLKNRVLYIDNLEVKNLELKESFLKDLLENNSSSTDESNATLPFDVIVANSVKLSVVNFTYDEYRVKEARVDIKNLKSDLKKEHRGEFELFIDSNLLLANLDGKLENNTYLLRGNIEGEESFLNQFLPKDTPQFSSNPKINIHLSRDVTSLKYELNAPRVSLMQNQYYFKTKSLYLKGVYGIESRDLEANLATKIDSNVAKLTVDVKSRINIEDINQTLQFDANIDLKPTEMAFIQSFNEQNMTLKAMPTIKINAKGDMEKSQLFVDIKGIKMVKDGLDIHLKNAHLKSDLKPLLGDVDADLKSEFDSSMGEGDLRVKSHFNIYDINSTLFFDAKSELAIAAAYVNNFLPDRKITLLDKTDLLLKAKGGVDALEFSLDSRAKVKTKEGIVDIQLKSHKALIDVKNHTLDTTISLNSVSDRINLDVKSDIQGDYLEPKLLTLNGRVNLLRFNAFGINLDTLTPLPLVINKGKRTLGVDIDSQKIKLKARSSNLSQFDFSLHTKDIYPYKIVKLPLELDKKFINLNLDGSFDMLSQYFKLKGRVGSNRDFKLNIDARNSASGLKANIYSKEFKLEAKGSLEKRAVVAKVNIDSLSNLQKEFSKLYGFEPIAVDGKLHLDAEVNQDRVSLNLASPKLKFERFNLEKIDIDMAYRRDLLTINKLSFNTTGFKKKSLNQHYYLNQKGFVHLGKRRDILLDMHPKIVIKGRGDESNLKAKVVIKSLPIGHPEYGDTLLSCDIDYIQTLSKKRILGEIFLDRLNLFYESKYLDPSYDRDVVVITKKDKEKSKEDGFIENTYIDLAIKAPDAHYETRDIKLGFSVKLKAKKEFSKTIRMLGKIEEINGRVEQAPKVFKVVDSNIVFRGAKEINPLLDLTVEYELPDILITIAIHGNAKRPKLTFSSNPPMPKKDILSYLLLGVSTASLAKGEGSLGREAQLFIMNQAARDLAYEVDLDRVLIKDDGTGEGYAIQVGKKVSKDTMVIIENSKEGNSFILEYDVNRNIKVEIGQHQKSIPSQSVDIYFRKRFK